MNDFSHLKAWLELPDETKLNIFSETSRAVGLPVAAIEKDWWVTHTLSIIFSMECAPALVFKGGTSLSKGWGLIERFSEDIDLALDKEHLGFEDPLSNRAVERLRQSCYQFVTTRFAEEFQAKFAEAGFPNISIKCLNDPKFDKDPVTVEILYPSLTETTPYLKPRLLVEIVSRSLKEPFSNRTIGTWVAEKFADRPFSDKPIEIPTVNPERTLLEKIFLLHEEFQKDPEKIRVERLSRHLYDIEKLSQTEFAGKALQNADLYKTIVTHRAKFNAIQGVNYANHSPDKITFIPPGHLLTDWETDYHQMRENMIYGDALNFADLIQKLTALQNQINGISWEK